MLLAATAQNARKKAQILCKASGVKLGQLLSIDYNWANHSLTSPTRYSIANGAAEGMAKRAAAANIVPEDIQATDSAAFIWEIQ